MSHAAENDAPFDSAFEWHCVCGQGFHGRSQRTRHYNRCPEALGYVARFAERMREAATPPVVVGCKWCQGRDEDGLHENGCRLGLGPDECVIPPAVTDEATP